MLRRSTLPAAILAVFGSLALNATAHASADYKASARLFGSTALKGKAVYIEKQRDGTTMQRFKVEVENGVPATTLNVRLNGNLLGSITLNAFGRGELEFRTAQFIDDPGDGEPIPANFPRPGTGDLVAVGPLSGVFFDPLSSGDVQRFRLEGEFVGPNSINGDVRYEERFDDGQLQRRFKVEIEDARPGSTYNVTVRGQVVGTITVGSFGVGKLQLRTAAFIDSPGDGIPMPDSFPSLKAGDVVLVGSMSATLAVD